jgi:hypothetical protein
MEITVGEVFKGIFEYAVMFWGATWWFWLFFLLFKIARSSWLYWKNTVFEQTELGGKGAVVLEMKIPREVLRSPRSMDQFFQAMAYVRNAEGNLGEKYVDGEVTLWQTYEIVSFSGEIHFYIRMKRKQKMLLEAAMFSYYPEVELEEVEDYIHRLPHHVLDIKAANASIFGSEVILKKEGGWPINTYLEFESPDEEHQTDPMSAFVENLGKAKKGEFFGIQYNCAPLPQTAWAEEFEGIVETLRTPQSLDGGHGGHSSDPADLVKAVTLQKSPGQTDVLKIVERNLSKPAFKVVIRFMYIGPNNTFYDTYARRAITSSFNQFGSGDLNSFVLNAGMTTKQNSWEWPFLFPTWRMRAREQRILHTYLEREHEIHQWIGKLLTSHPLNWNNHSKGVVLSTEALASLFHPPTKLITTAPHTRRVESKKMGAPAGLPIYADESVLEKYK